MSDEPIRLERQLLTAREVAELLRLPVSTVYDLARTERLPHLRIGRQCVSAARTSRRTWPTFAVRFPGAVAPSWLDTRPATSGQPVSAKVVPATGTRTAFTREERAASQEKTPALPGLL